MPDDAMFDDLTDDELIERYRNIQFKFSGGNITNWDTPESEELDRRYAERKAKAELSLVRKAIPLPWVKPINVVEA